LSYRAHNEGNVSVKNTSDWVGRRPFVLFIVNKFRSIKNEMGRACGTYGGIGEYRVWVGKPEGRAPLGRWEDNIKIDNRSL
jgi:hypothetical protein